MPDYIYTVKVIVRGADEEIEATNFLRDRLGEFQELDRALKVESVSEGEELA